MANARVISPHSGGKAHTRWIDGLIAALAGPQQGVVARWQLLAAGVGERAIELRIERGRLHPVHRGVYAVGHRVLSREGQWMAAVLAAGEDVALSHRSAAAHWGIRQDSRPVTDITVPRALRSRPLITMHRGAIASDEITAHEGIPVTTVPRTILDLAAERPRREVERALHEVDVRRLYDTLSLHDLVARYPNRQGTGTVKLILASRDEEAAITHERLEELFHSFLHRFRLPLPKFNQWLEIGGRWIEADAVWHEQKVIAELDGRAVHDTDRLYESDRLRDRRLQVARWRPIRITWRQLKYDAAETAADLRVLLAA